MKRTSFPSYLFILSLLLLLVSCKNDPCEKTDCENGTCVDGTCECFGEWQGVACDDGSCIGIECENGGTCLSGECNCEAPYFGARCDSLIDNQFVGAYEVTGDCVSAPYIIILLRQADSPGQMWIRNLEENGISLSMRVRSETVVDISHQVRNEIYYFGFITRVDENTLTITYSVDRVGRCILTLRKY